MDPDEARLAPAIDLPVRQLAADITIRSALRFGQSLDRNGAMLRVNALIEAVSFIKVSLQGSSSAIAPSAPQIEQLKVFVLLVNAAQLANK
jgi:hypothetical protein